MNEICNLPFFLVISNSSTISLIKSFPCLSNFSTLSISISNSLAAASTNFFKVRSLTSL